MTASLRRVVCVGTIVMMVPIAVGAVGKAADKDCKPPSETEWYDVGKPYLAVLREKPRVNNIANKICTDTTNNVTTVGHCIAANDCHADKYCDANTGSCKPVSTPNGQNSTQPAGNDGGSKTDSNSQAPGETTPLPNHQEQSNAPAQSAGNPSPQNNTVPGPDKSILDALLNPSPLSNQPTEHSPWQAPTPEQLFSAPQSAEGISQLQPPQQTQTSNDINASVQLPPAAPSSFPAPGETNGDTNNTQSEISRAIQQTVQQTEQELSNLLSGTKGTPQSSEPDSTYGRIAQATNVMCQVYGCDGDFTAKYIGAVCAQEATAGCTADIQRPGSQYAGPSQTTEGKAQIVRDMLDTNIANNPDLNASDRATAQAIVDRYDDIKADGGDPRRDSVVGPWILAGQQMQPPEMGSSAWTAQDINQRYAGDVGKAAAAAMTVQIAPGISSYLLKPDDTVVPNSVVRALQNNGVWVQPGNTVGDVVSAVQGAYGNRFQAGISAVSAYLDGQSSPQTPQVQLAQASTLSQTDTGFPVTPQAQPVDSAKQIAPASNIFTNDAPTNYQLNNDLSYGSRGADVKALQQRLIDDGYLPAGLDTGYFGPKTLAAVRQLQAQNFLGVDGIVGSRTRALLNAAR